MEEATLAERLKKTLDNYISHNGQNINKVLFYKSQAERFLKRNKNSNGILEKLILESEAKIIKNNRGLVVKKAKYYSNIPEFQSYLSDFISEGTIGLIKATRGGFTPKRGEFHNYAAVSISQSILRKIKEIDSSIKFPVNIYFDERRIDYYLGCFKKKNKKIPTDEELAAFSGMPICRIKRLRMAKGLFFTSSLNEKLDGKDDGVYCLIDRVSSNYSLEDEVINKMIYQELIKRINELPNKKQKVILIKRLEGKTLSEIGLEENLTKERIRQIQNKAILKIKNTK